MRTAKCLVILCAAVMLAADANKPKDQIVGKWEPADAQGKVVIEFTKDGMVKVSVAGTEVKIEGKYKFLDDENMQIDLTVMGQSKSDKLKVAIDKDELTTTDSQGKTDKMRRVK